ncbi:MAG: aspartate aminotransferase family protein [Desulfobacterales bacterium]|nr:MAG: aspartate aminotransferase family protein [Desulfobacterales bacterium]
MNRNIMKTADQTIARTYLRQPVALERGEGMRVWDADGREYLDFIAGIAVCALGHAHPRIADAVDRQARRLVHVSNLYYTAPQAGLAAELTRRSFADRVFFCNSGAEANEAAIKLARRYFHEQGNAKRRTVITALGSFHGRTMATLSATGQDKIKTGFDPLLPGFVHVPYNNLEAVRAAADETAAAVLLEPIQGEGGVVTPAPGYLEGVRRFCDEMGILLIFDEIQTGMGRTGLLFAHEKFGVTPDVMTLAKALANGFPIGAMLATEQVAAAFTAGSHATTFGGAPVIAAAALETLRLLTDGGVVEHGRLAGEHLFRRLNELKAAHPVVREIRGAGLLAGIVLPGDAAPLVDVCREKGFLVNAVQGNILRLAPPLIVENREIDALMDCLNEVLPQMEEAS